MPINPPPSQVTPSLTKNTKTSLLVSTHPPLIQGVPSGCPPPSSGVPGLVAEGTRTPPPLLQGVPLGCLPPSSGVSGLVVEGTRTPPPPSLPQLLLALLSPLHTRLVTHHDMPYSRSLITVCRTRGMATHHDMPYSRSQCAVQEVRSLIMTCTTRPLITVCRSVPY